VKVHLWTHQLHGAAKNDLIHQVEMLDKEVKVFYYSPTTSGSRSIHKQKQKHPQQLNMYLLVMDGCRL
jgi:hypothetical protein